MVGVVENRGSPVEREEDVLRGDCGVAEAELTGGRSAVGGVAAATGGCDRLDLPGKRKTVSRG